MHRWLIIQHLRMLARLTQLQRGIKESMKETPSAFAAENAVNNTNLIAWSKETVAIGGGRAGSFRQFPAVRLDAEVNGIAALGAEVAAFGFGVPFAALKRDARQRLEAGLASALGDALSNAAALVSDTDFFFKEVERAKQILENSRATAPADYEAASFAEEAVAETTSERVYRAFSPSVP